MNNLRHILKTYWGYDSFRPLQEDIISSILNGRDTLALLPTGGGKSLCFQVPAIAGEGLCLVISPLIALMKDQVENLRRKNITAFAVHSGMTRMEVKDTLRVAGNSNCKLLYVSPERLETPLFKEYLPSLNVRLLAVDEAHCISQWGYDFRPSYLRIAELRNELVDVPVLALTASATPDVQNDICEKLLFKNKIAFKQSFARPNLSYSSFKCDSKISKIIDIASKVNGTGIVYCKSRKRTRQISEALNLNNISADFYHAGLPADARSQKQENWVRDKKRVIVCTNAFGMGIDKPDVRFVIHADVPDCLENYYQEAGRAGRDGKKSYAVLLFTSEELTDITASVERRFPTMAEVRHVYKSLMNYLQVPSGTGEGKYLEFDLLTFARQFKLTLAQSSAVLKILEQEELLYFNEQVYIPARVKVIATRERMRELESTSPSSDHLIKTLLRSFEGIFDQAVSINEKTIAKLLKTTVDLVISDLTRLHQSGDIIYIPQKEKPQVFLRVNRVKAEDLYIDSAKYTRRKELYLQRSKKMVSFTTEQHRCRSVIIGNYFGDESIKECGICDNCLSRRKTRLDKDEFTSIETHVIRIISEGPVAIQQVIEQVHGFPKDKTNEVLNFMLAEEKITSDHNGRIFPAGTGPQSP